MPSINDRITATSAEVGRNLSLGTNSAITGQKVKLGDNVLIGDNVEIIGDEVTIGEGTRIAGPGLLIAPTIAIGRECSIGPSITAELNVHLEIGPFGSIGREAAISGQGVRTGDFLILRNHALIGGGGASGPNAYLTIGNRCTFIDRCFFNISERITIGEHVGVSSNVSFLTHGAWEPVLKGCPTKFAPISIGDYAALYLNVVILPGVTVGARSWIASNSVVTRDVPPDSLAGGNPARILKGPGNWPECPDLPRIEAMIGTILSDWLLTLPPKGVTVHAAGADRPWPALDWKGLLETVGFIPSAGSVTVLPDISLAYGPLPETLRGACHFDLCAETVVGQPSALAEDLRDYLRRRGIRIFTDRHFRSLPLDTLQRLRSLRRKKS